MFIYQRVSYIFCDGLSALCRWVVTWLSSWHWHVGSELASFGKWVCLKMGYTLNYSHLVGIMISKTIGFRGLANIFRQTQVACIQVAQVAQVVPGLTHQWEIWRLSRNSLSWINVWRLWRTGGTVPTSRHADDCELPEGDMNYPAW